MTVGRVVVFDLDGTLIDSAPAIAASVNHVRAVLCRGPLPVDRVRRFMGDGVEAVVDRALAVDDGDVPSDRSCALQQFLRHHERDAGHLVSKRPGADGLLGRLEAEGYALGLCTNKLTRLTIPLLAELGWTDFFRCVVCGDTLSSRKPDPAPLLLAIEQCGGGNAVFVGDTQVDVATAAAVRIPCILVGQGNDVADGACNEDVFVEDIVSLRSRIAALLGEGEANEYGGTSASRRPRSISPY